MASIQSKILKFWLRRLNVFESKNHDPQALRARAEQATFLARAHRDVQVIPVQAGSVPAEWLAPRAALSDRVVLYIHGGAWFMCSPLTHRSLASRLAYTSGIRVLSLDYRLAPEHPFPAGLEDCIQAYEWLLQSGISPQKIVVAGDSAGGNLALAMLVALRDMGKQLPAGAVGLSPATDLTGASESHRTRAHLDPFFHNMGPNSIIPDYIGSHDPQHPWISPLYADLKGLPPILLQAGDHETLLDDSLRFSQRAAEAGVEVKTVVWPGMFHVFQIWTPFLPEACEAVDQIAAFITLRLNDNGPNVIA